jgi:hypothetical protein
MPSKSNLMKTIQVKLKYSKWRNWDKVPSSKVARLQPSDDYDSPIHISFSHQTFRPQASTIVITRGTQAIERMTPA